MRGKSGVVQHSFISEAAASICDLQSRDRRTRSNQDTTGCKALTMRFSFKFLFLGCWLTGQWGLSGTQPYLKPSIWVRPSKMVALGGNITIHCRSEGHQQMEFYLQKADSSYISTLCTQVAEWEEVMFPIVNAKQRDGGIYWCTYCPKLSCEQQWSESSNRICINITDPSLPKPSIQVRPREQSAPGLNVTIECKGPEHSMSFVLHKSKNQTASQTIGPASITAKFLLPTVRLEDAGNYTCQYRLRGSPFVWSEPSDPVELILIVTLFPETNIRLGVAGLVLLALVLIVAEATYSWRKGQFPPQSACSSTPVPSVQVQEKSQEPDSP